MAKQDLRDTLEKLEEQLILMRIKLEERISNDLEKKMTSDEEQRNIMNQLEKITELEDAIANIKTTFE